ncbi:MAG: PLP-dependent aminotransferase family protein [Actinomycetota bacterium]|nr:PLP-dependent aminotransferase family protein [Actinomycetota bacterium]
MPLNASELLVVLGPDGPVPLRVRLTNALRDAVRSGRVAPGSTLPSSRVLARDLGVSRGVVTEAYAQLAAEGFVRSRPGAGTTVTSPGVHTASVSTLSHARPTLAPGTIDLRPGLPDLSSFPRQQWAAAVRDTLRDLPAPRLGYTEPWGALALREQLSQYLARVRGASVHPESVVVTTGATQGISLIAQLLRRRGHRYVAVEDPSNAIQRRLLTELGLSVVDVPVDWQGLAVDVLAASPARVVICTPAHQYPTGVVMSASRREQLCRWAQEQDALIVEDDYDSEFSYGPVVEACLQGVVPQHVALLGSVSKSLAPALRLGWIVAPPSLLMALRQAKSHADFGSNFLEQEVLAELIASAAYDRNLRRLRRRYSERRQCLATALSRQLPGWRVMGAAAGLHFVVQVPDQVDETRLVAAAAAQGVAVIGIAGLTGSNPHGPAIVLSFAGATRDMLAEAVNRLAQAVASMDGLPETAARPALSRVEWYERGVLKA